MIIFNYTALKTRDTKIYSIGGQNFAGGISIEFLKVVGPVALIFIAIGFALSFVLGFNFYNPFVDNFHAWYTLTFLIVGIGLGCALWYIQFAGYRLYQYLAAYFKPKKVYSNDFKISEYKFNNIKIKTMVKNLL